MKYDWSLHAKPLDNVWFELKGREQKRWWIKLGLLIVFKIKKKSNYLTNKTKRLDIL